MVKDPYKRLTVSEAAKILGTCAKTVFRRIEKGEISAVKYLGQWRIKEDEVERILAGK